MNQRKHLLITGAAGRIGRLLSQQWRGQHRLRLTDIAAAPNLDHDAFFQADIANMDDIAPLFAGIDTVVHLAANPSIKAEWEGLLSPNLIGMYNVLEAAANAGCRRLIFASSVNVVIGYPPGAEIEVTMPVAPGNLYGATKAWGEAVGRYYADYRGLSVICLRLGWVVPRDHPKIRQGSHLLPMLLTHEDTVRLFDAALHASPDVRFGIFHGISDNRHKRLSIKETRRVLGFEPQDDAYVLAGISDA